MKLLNSSNSFKGERFLARRPTTFKTGHVGIESLLTIKNYDLLSPPSMR